MKRTVPNLHLCILFIYFKGWQFMLRPTRKFNENELTTEIVNLLTEFYD